jgi:methyl-accepting chemotaxis protein
MANSYTEKKGRGLFFKTIGITSMLLFVSLLLLGYLNINSMQQLALQTAVAMSENKLKGDMTIFEQMVMQKYGRLSLKNGALIDSSGVAVSYRYEVVDAISSDLNIVATIFVKENNDYRRIATSIANQGKRAIDTFLDSKGAAYPVVQSGREYIGETSILGKEYITLYKPIFGQGTNIIGILFIGIGMDSVKQMIKDKSDAQTIISIAIGVAILVLIILVNIINIKRVVITPVNSIVSSLKNISEGEGDLTKRINIRSGDEIGTLVNYFNKLMNTIQRPIGETKTAVSSLAKAADELSLVSSHLFGTSKETVEQVTNAASIAEQVAINIRAMASGAEQASVNANEVASTTEQMATNINAMASGAEQASVNANEVASEAKQMSSNINTIAFAVEDMSASINQIAGNASEAHKITEDAITKSSDATKVMDKLGIAAKEIGAVTNVIKKIADKTNLLALNASIEAASAGEAGKGFAVVANEVKELASQSAKSADDIANKIESIQAGTGEAVAAINNVSGIITKINQSVEAIAGYVEKQTKASNEIASNVAQTSTGAKRVASAIGEVAKGTNEIANNVVQASTGAKRVAFAIGEIAKGTSEIANNAAQASDGAKRVASAIGEIAKGSRDIATNASEAVKGTTNIKENMVAASDVAKESSQGASQVNASAGDLAETADRLRDVIGKFKV